jgi:hypothetical protein
MMPEVVDQKNTSSCILAMRTRPYSETTFAGRIKQAKNKQR